MWLDHNIAVASSAGVPQTVLRGLARQSDQATIGLQRTASRLRTFSKLQTHDREVEASITAQTEKLQKVIDALRRARVGLAKLTLADRGDDALEEVQAGLDMLSAVVDEVLE
jgi:hypothetical protein